MTCQKNSQKNNNRNRKTSLSRKARALLRIFALLVLLAVINAGLSYVLEPYMGSSEEMWTNYRKMASFEAPFSTDMMSSSDAASSPESVVSLDTVYTGTSQCLQGIDPAVVDRETGGTSYNMATNMQSFADSEEAIRSAVRDYGIKRAVLAIDHEMLGIDRSDDARASQSFWHGKAVSESSFAAAVRDSWTFMTSDAFFGKPAGLTYLTPWVYNRTSDLALNLQEKKEQTILNSAGHRTAQGYQPSDGILDPDWQRISWEEADRWDEVAEDLQDLNITDSNLAALASLRDYCRENGVQLIVIILPYPNHFSIYRKAQYLAVDAQLSALFDGGSSVSSEGDASISSSADSTASAPSAATASTPSSAGGSSFYDFNLLLPEYYDDSSNALYADVGHMNSTGAAQFSAFFGDFLNRLDRGEDLSVLFRTIS